MNEITCCGECLDYANDDAKICCDSSCPCHQPSTQTDSTEKRFDERFKKELETTEIPAYIKTDVLAFFTQELARRKEEMVKNISALKFMSDHKYDQKTLNQALLIIKEGFEKL